MAGVTNRGKFTFLRWALVNTAAPVNTFVHLLTPATAPTAGTNDMSAVTQIVDGNGYNTAGYTLARNDTDWDTFTEQDASTNAIAQMKDIVWTASGATLSGAGCGARYAILCNSGALATREILAWWDLGAEYIVSDGQTLTLQNTELDANES